MFLACADIGTLFNNDSKYNLISILFLKNSKKVLYYLFTCGLVFVALSVIVFELFSDRTNFRNLKQSMITLSCLMFGDSVLDVLDDLEGSSLLSISLILVFIFVFFLNILQIFLAVTSVGFQRIQQEFRKREAKRQRQLKSLTKSGHFYIRNRKGNLFKLRVARQLAAFLRQKSSAQFKQKRLEKIRKLKARKQKVKSNDTNNQIEKTLLIKGIEHSEIRRDLVSKNQFGRFKKGELLNEIKETKEQISENRNLLSSGKDSNLNSKLDQSSNKKSGVIFIKGNSQNEPKSKEDTQSKTLYTHFNGSLQNNIYSEESSSDDNSVRSGPDMLVNEDHEIEKKFQLIRRKTSGSNKARELPNLMEVIIKKRGRLISGRHGRENANHVLRSATVHERDQCSGSGGHTFLEF